MGQKFFLHKNKKACYNNIDTCSCGLFFLGKLAGLTRRGLVYASQNQVIISRNRSTPVDFNYPILKSQILKVPNLSQKHIDPYRIYSVTLLSQGNFSYCQKISF
ncbi:MAG: hypothetical protein LBG13_02995 [Holosporales bacterium]|jgi:hypothetical protein|nr:hypothetical protein [Holosporales bacterium]